jgi:DNA polymerase elongation subunit (family B)
MHLEILAVNRGKLLPDPELDPVCCIFYLLHGDRGLKCNMGIIAVKQDELMVTSVTSPEYKAKCEAIEIVEDETEAFTRLVQIVQLHNPDILMGYEVGKSSAEIFG